MYSSEFLTGGDVAVCAIVKNESAHIVEWIAHHRLIGVQKVFLYDNGSTDGLTELLAPLVNNGIVDLVDWPHNPGQLEAYHHFLAKHGKDWTWTAFIDADEYINIFGSGDLRDFLARFGEASGVTLQWMNFGPSDHEHPPSDLTIASYTYRLPWNNPVHGHVKTIARSRDVIRAITPHSFDTRGVVFDEHRKPVIINDGDYAIQPIIDHDEICINHYYTRSRTDWAEKVGRGMADSPYDAPNRRDLTWFDDYARDANVEDDRLARRAARVRAEIERLRSLR